MDNIKARKISFTIENGDYDKLKKFQMDHANCLEKYPNMTGAQFKYSFVPDGLGVFTR